MCGVRVLQAMHSNDFQPSKVCAIEAHYREQRTIAHLYAQIGCCPVEKWLILVWHRTHLHATRSIGSQRDAAKNNENK